MESKDKAEINSIENKINRIITDFQKGINNFLAKQIRGKKNKHVKTTNNKNGRGDITTNPIGTKVRK